MKRVRSAIALVRGRRTRGSDLREAPGRLRAEISGLSGIEFALIAPILVLAAIVSFDLGTGIYDQMQVQNAAQAGAEYAALKGFNSSGISNAVTSATSLAAISATPAPSQFCGCPSSSGITVATCNSTCPSGEYPGSYITVSAKAQYSTILPYPGFPSSYTLVSQSTVRTQ